MAYVCMGSNMGEPETNLARAREVLGWTPEVTVEEGVAKTVEFFRNK